MPPAIIAAGVVAAGAIGGAVISSGAQKSAANTAAQAQQQATSQELQLGRENIAFQQGIYDKNTALLTPFVQRGDAAGNQINALLGLGGTQAPAPSPAAAQPAAPAAPTQGYQTTPTYTQEPIYGGGGSIQVEQGQDGNGAGGFALKPMWSDIRARFNDLGGEQQNALNPNTQTVANPTVPAAAPQSAAPAATGQPSSQSDAFNQFAHSAGIDFQIQQGTNALQHSAAARGMLQSGATLKGLQNYGQNTALNNYFLPYMGLLQGQQATGAQSGAAIAGVGSNFGNTVSSIYGGQQNAIGNGANALSNAALLRGQANAKMGNTIGSALGTFGSSFFQPSSGGSSLPAGGYNTGGGTANYFAANPFGRSS
jgi:hypothetical protein